MFVVFSPAPTAFAQSADALIDKLVEKGILTVKEAKELREEADQGFTQAYSVKSGLSEWVTSLNLNGDLRGRYEGFFSDNPAFVDRHRLRYRLRAGFTAVMKDQLEVGFRLSSSQSASGFSEGDPISSNTTFNNNASRKSIFIDLAYAKWSPVNGPDWTAAVTFGKMENPFVFPSTMVFDRDYTPEGFAQELSYHLNSNQTLKLIGGEFILDELAASSKDPWLFGAQMRLNSTWSPKISSSFGVGFFGLLGEQNLSSANVPDIGRGNARTAGGDLVFNYHPVYVDGSVTYMVEHFPGYRSSFPVTLSGDYLYNPAVSEANQGYSIGLTLGKAGKKGLWDVAYRWTELQADAWYEEFTESDFGAFYQTAPVGGRAGYASGTNLRGHTIKASFSTYDSLTFSLTYFLTELSTPSPAGSQSGIGRLQFDAVWKF